MIPVVFRLPYVDANQRTLTSFQSGNTSMLHSSVFEHYIFPEVERLAKSPDAEQWDNWSNGETHNVNESGSVDITKQLSQCRSICDKDKECVQYKVNSGLCTISTKPFSVGQLQTASRNPVGM